MGVNNLWKLLSVSGRHISLNDLQGSVVAIDVSIWMIRIIHGMAKAGSQQFQTGHLIGILKRLLYLMEHQIKPIFVFDGPAPALKRKTLMNRQKHRNRSHMNLQKVAERYVVKLMEKGIDIYQNNEIEEVEQVDLHQEIDNDISEPIDEEVQIIHEQRRNEVLKIKYKYLTKNDPNSLPVEIFDQLPEHQKYEILDDIEDYSTVNDIQQYIAKALMREELRNVKREADKQLEMLKIRKILDEFDDENAAFLKNYLLNTDDLEMKLGQMGVNNVFLFLEDKNEQKKLIDRIEGHCRLQKKKKLKDWQLENAHMQNIRTTIRRRYQLKQLEANEELEQFLREDEVEEKQFSIFQDRYDICDREQVRNILLAQLVEDEDLCQQDQFPKNEIINNQENIEKIEKISTAYESISKDKDIVNQFNQSYKTDILENVSETISPFKHQYFQNDPAIDENLQQTLQKSELCLEDFTSISKSWKGHSFKNNQKNQEKQYIPQLQVQQFSEKKGRNDYSQENQLKENEQKVGSQLQTQQFSQEKQSDYYSQQKEQKSKEQISISQEQLQQFLEKEENDLSQQDLLNKQISVSQLQVQQYQEKKTGNDFFYQNTQMSNELLSVQQINVQQFQENSINPQDQVNEIISQKYQFNNQTETPLEIKRDKPEEEFQLFDNDINITTEEMLQNIQQYANMNSLDFGSLQTKFDEVKLLLSIFGVPWVDAPAEAEAQCSFLQQAGLVDFIVTDDSDAFLFGGIRLIKGLFDRNQVLEYYDIQLMQEELGLSRDKLVYMALFLGSDYTEGVKGIGIVNAMEIVEAFDSLPALQRFASWACRADVLLPNHQVHYENIPEKERIYKELHKNFKKQWEMPKSFPSDEVIDGYMNPLVDQSREQFSWGSPALEKIQQFCIEILKWDSTKTNDNVIEPLERILKQQEQKKITDYFKPQMHQKIAQIKSRRIKDAVSNLINPEESRLQIQTPSRRRISDNFRPKKNVTIKEIQHDEDPQELEEFVFKKKIKKPK